MDEPWIGIVTEVKRREIEQVENKQDFARSKMAVDPEDDKGESQQVML